MKISSFIVSLAILCSQLLANPPDIEGTWNGLLETHGMKLRLVFNIEKTSEGYKATLDSPDQGAKGIEANLVAFEDQILTIEIAMAGITYRGLLENQKITGKLIQFGMEVPLNLSKDAIEVPRLIRPQEPIPPFPYHYEDVRIYNEKAGIYLVGTFSYPFDGENLPAVVLVTGSGPQNRNEEIFGHKPFLVISDYLTRNGIAVLRFDDRGVAESEGDFQSATSLDFATDVRAAIQFLKNRLEVDPSKIGIAGHSEGGLIAAMVAADYPDHVGFVISLGGPGVTGKQIILAQQKLIGRASGIDDDELEKAGEINRKIFEIVIQNDDKELLESKLLSIFSEAISEGLLEVPEGISPDVFLSLQIQQITNPWMRFFLSYDPAISWQKVKCPVLALNGENDLQVPAKENLKAIKEAVTAGGNLDVTIIEMAGLNHLFQECETGLPALYGIIEQTFSTEALEVMKNWIRERFVD